MTHASKFTIIWGSDNMSKSLSYAVQITIKSSKQKPSYPSSTVLVRFVTMLERPGRFLRIKYYINNFKLKNTPVEFSPGVHIKVHGGLLEFPFLQY